MFFKKARAHRLRAFLFAGFTAGFNAQKQNRRPPGNAERTAFS